MVRREQNSSEIKAVQHVDRLRARTIQGARQRELEGSPSDRLERGTCGGRCAVDQSQLDEEIFQESSKIISKMHFILAKRKRAYISLNIQGDSANPFNYNPHPVDMTNLTLSREMQNMAERLADNAHDIWAKKKKEELITCG